MRTKRRKTAASVSYIRNVDVMVADLCHAMPARHHANGIILFDILL